MKVLEQELDMGLHGNVKVDLLDNLQVFSYSYLSGIQEAMLARHIVLLKQITEGVSEQVTQGHEVVEKGLGDGVDAAWCAASRWLCAMCISSVFKGN